MVNRGPVSSCDIITLSCGHLLKTSIASNEGERAGDSPQRPGACDNSMLVISCCLYSALSLPLLLALNCYFPALTLCVCLLLATLRCCFRCIVAELACWRA